MTFLVNMYCMLPISYITKIKINYSDSNNMLPYKYTLMFESPVFGIPSIKFD